MSTALPTDRRVLVRLLADTRTQLIATQTALRVEVTARKVCERAHTYDASETTSAEVFVEAERTLARLPVDPDAQTHVDALIQGLR